MSAVSVALVVPTLGRPTLPRLLGSLDRSIGPRPDRVVLVDDRRSPVAPVVDSSELPAWLRGRVSVRHAGGRGPAAARNVGWRSVDAEWIAFVDDDVVLSGSWLRDLAADLAAATDEVAGVQGRLTVPLPPDRRPTDWERTTAGLSGGRWITADMAYRRVVLAAVGGFDERFPRAFREDADLALRVLGAGHRLVIGTRAVTHPVRPARWSVSLRAQRGNADDALMRRLHGGDWRDRAGAPRGRWLGHAAITAAGSAAAVLAVAGRRRAATLAGAAGTAGIAEFAWARIAPGPRDPAEIARMLVTSALIPPYAAWHRLLGTIGQRSAPPWVPRPIEALLVDRDGTLVHDVPYNGDPHLVTPLPGVRTALDRVRAAGLPVAVISNQSGVARDLLSQTDVASVNARIEEMLGPFDAWHTCPHAPLDGCSCRKPKPGLVHSAAQSLRVPVERCVVIGDIGADMTAAATAGAFGILVPTAQTRPEEVAMARVVRPNFEAAVDLVLPNGYRRRRG
jgi:histidinol-phosphate phosphatase family protein